VQQKNRLQEDIYPPLDAANPIIHHHYRVWTILQPGTSILERTGVRQKKQLQL
jgi:hypothetical protein